MKITTTILFAFVFTIILGVINESNAQRFRLEEDDGTQLEVSFDAYRLNNTIQFVWNTNTESNISAYEIVKGTENGKYLDWETVAVVNVNRSNANDYTYVEDTPVLGEMHYRLKILAPDGSSVEYSPLYKVSKRNAHAQVSNKSDIHFKN